MLSEKIEASLNNQLNKELFSAYLYLSMSAYFAEKNLEGMATWMDVQAKEEMTHAMKFYNFIIERGGRVLLKAIEGPKTTWECPCDAFNEAYEHEQFITKSIYEIVDQARTEKDFATDIFLNWFVTEQAEEEASVDAVIQKLKMVKDSADGLFLMDRELGTRQFVDETAK